MNRDGSFQSNNNELHHRADDNHPVSFHVSADPTHNLTGIPQIERIEGWILIPERFVENGLHGCPGLSP
jgi:hypothetical protein